MLHTWKTSCMICRDYCLIEVIIVYLSCCILVWQFRHIYSLMLLSKWDIVNWHDANCMCCISLSFNVSLGTFSHVVHTCSVGRLVVFPFNESRLGPKMFSGWIMFCLVRLKFGIILSSTYLIKSSMLGLPIMLCSMQVYLALEYCLIENLFLALSTVVTKVVLMSFVKSKWHSPFLESLNTHFEPFALFTTKPPSSSHFLDIVERQIIHYTSRLVTYGAISFQVTFLGHRFSTRIAVLVQSSFCITNVW